MTRYVPLIQKPRTFNQEQLQPLQKLSLHIATYLNLIREQNHFYHEHELIDISPAVLLKWSNFRGFNLTYVSNNVEKLFGIPPLTLLERDMLFEDYIDESTLDNLSSYLLITAMVSPMVKRNFD
ncbi:hypothetical protein [Vibrio tritonius]|uniref:hypothetical protein n=1 Tax=Vibrio tritonius TaxID=1435069 RepID=UPI00315D8136